MVGTIELNQKFSKTLILEIEGVFALAKYRGFQSAKPLCESFKLIRDIRR